MIEEFKKLPNSVQEIALKKMAQAKDKSDLIIKLDDCEELRHITETKHGSYVKEVDVIARAYDAERARK